MNNSSDLFSYIKQKAIDAYNGVSNFVTQNPTPNGFISKQIQQVPQIAQNVLSSPTPKFLSQTPSGYKPSTMGNYIFGQNNTTDNVPDVRKIAQTTLENMPALFPLGGGAPPPTSFNLASGVKNTLPIVALQHLSGEDPKNIYDPKNLALNVLLGGFVHGGNKNLTLDEILSKAKTDTEGNIINRSTVNALDRRPFEINNLFSGEGNKIPQKTNFYTSPEGLTVPVERMSEVPKTSRSLDQIMSQAKEVNQVAPIETKPGMMLPSPETNIRGALPVPQPKPLTPIQEMFKVVAKEGGLVGKTSKYFEQVLEPKRFLEKVLPDKIFEPVKKVIFDKLNVFRGEAADFKNNYVKKVESLGKEFSIGSKYSELTQKLGEGKITYEQVVSQVGENNAQKIVNANNTFRAMYDEILNIVNENRIADGLPEISRRKDYYRHMQEMGGSGDWLSQIISGGSGQKSSSIMKERKGAQTTYDAVGGFIDYLDRAGRAGFTDRISKTVTQLSNALKEKGASPQVTSYLDDYAGNILGIAKDEGAVVNAANNVASKMRGARVLGNIGSIISQPLNTSLGANDAGIGNYLKGFISKEAESASKASPYLKDRSFSIPTSLQSGWGKVKGVMGSVLQNADVVSTKQIWKGFYEKAKSLGEVNPVQWADDATEGVVGSRGVGGFAKIQTTKLGQLLAPFTVEPQAGANRIIELVGEKKFGTLVGIAATNFLVNEGFEKLGPGYRPLMDPIKATMDAYQLYTGTKEKDPNKLQAATRLIVEMMGVAPIAQSIAASAYNIGESAKLLPPAKTVFGQEDPTRLNVADLYNPASNINRNVTGNKLIDYPLNIASKLIPGVNQVAKGAQGIRMSNQGYADSKAGNVMFQTPQDAVSKTRAAIFGPWASQEARNYFNSGVDKTLTQKESDTYKQLSKDQKSTYLDKTQANKVTNSRLNSMLKSGNISSSGSSDYATVKSYVSRALTGGAVPSKEDIKLGYFNNHTASSPLLEEKTKVYSSLKSALNSDTYTPDQKQAILEASGASKNDVEYYLQSSKDKDIKLQEILPKIENMGKEELLTYLASGKKSIAGSQLITSDMITYLYDHNIINKDEQSMLNALKFDEGNGKFYFSKSFASGGKKKISYAQAKSMFNVKIPSFSSMHGSVSKQSSSAGATLLQGIINKKPKKIKFKK